MDPRPTVLSICSGVGMLDLGLRLAVDARTVCYVEREIPSVQIMARRMEDGTLDAAPVWSDLTTLDARGLRGVDILAGGIPCQPFSSAGERRGNEDHRALAPHVLRIVAECLPSVVFIENVPPWVLLGYARGFLEGLSDMGYCITEPLFCRASDFGAPHRRERVFVMAYREGFDRSVFLQSWRSIEAGRQSDRSGGEVAEPANVGHERAGIARNGGGVDLRTTVDAWATPNLPSGGRTLTSEQTKNKGKTNKGKRQVDLANQSRVFLLDQEPTGPESTRDSGRPRLNPLFVEWLMGLPVGYTDSEPLETESFLSWWRMHFELLLSAIEEPTR